jgi:hypothetical protein
MVRNKAVVNGKYVLLYKKTVLDLMGYEWLGIL